MADKYIPKKAVSGKVLLRNWWNSVVESNFSAIFKAFSEHVAGTADKHSAEHIDYDENTDLKTKIDRKADKTYVDESLERIKYYGSADIMPSDESWFTVNETGGTITGLTDTGKTQTELVVPYKINGVEISVIGGMAFYMCANLTSVTIPNSVTKINSSAFEYSKLASITIPDSIKSIGYRVFAHTRLTSVTIPDSVTSIDRTAFSGCSNLTSITIGKSVTSIGLEAFKYCTNLTIYCEQGSYADTYAKENGIPVVYTEVDSTSLVGKATSEGGEIFNDYTNNKAVSNYSHASGSNTIAGIKGYYYTMQSTTELTIYKDQARTVKAQVPTSWLNGRISLVNDNKYDNVATISSIGSDGSSIVITPELPFSSIVSVSNPSLDDYSITCLDAPLDGEIDFGSNAIAMGEGSKALNRDSFTTGRDNEAIGQYSFATGRNNIVAYGGIASGRNNKAKGTYSYVGGYKTEASGSGSYAHGLNTKATGDYSHAEGADTVASGGNAHAEGQNTVARGGNAHSEGCATIATGDHQHVQGKYNIEDISWKYAHIVGNGTSDTARSNAHTLDWNGNAWYAGNVKVGGTSYDDADATELATKKYVDNAIVDEVNAALEQKANELSVLKQRSIPHIKVSGYPISVTDHLETEQVIDYKVYGNSVQDGTPSTENPIEIKSVGDLVTDETSEYYGKYDIPIDMRSKNIFSGLTKGIGINSSNGSEVTNKNYSVSDYIPVDFNVNNNYFISGLPTTISTLIAAYNINKEFLGRTQSLRTSKKLITSDIFINGTPQATGDVVYLRVLCYVNKPDVETIDDIDGCNIQLEIGNTATEYEPYNSGEVKHIYLDEPLRKVGDYADYIDCGNQKIIRQVEVLDDTGTKTIDESLGVLDTPTEESITIPELTTPISSVANVSIHTTIKPSNMELTYYQDINKKIAELQAAITALGGI